MGKSSRIVSYMEERYGKTFTYTGEVNGTFGSRSYTARLSCPEEPEAVILASYREQDGEEYYADNYPAVRFHDDALQKIEEAVRQVYADYQIFFRIPDILLTIEDPDAYTLEDYLADPLAFKSVHLLVCEEVDETSFQALMRAFADASISIKGLVAVPKNPSEAVVVSEETVDDFLADPDRVQTQVNFTVENGTLTNEKWRQ